MRRSLLLAALLVLASPVSAHAAGPAVSVQAAPIEGAAPLRVTLTAAGDAASYSWDFGDGSGTSYGASVEHVYGTAGRYTATVTATAESGETAQATVGITAYSLSLHLPKIVRYGRTVRFRGVLRPAEPDVQVVLQRDGRGVGAALVRPNGSFRLRTRVYRPGLYQASFMDVQSPALQLRVRPRLTARIVGTPLVGSRLALVARLRPASAGSMRIRIFRGSRRVYSGLVHGSARIPLDTHAPHLYTAKVETVASTGFTRPAMRLRTLVSMPNLGPGSRGPSVQALEARLRELHYALEGVDGYYGLDTYHAVTAFQKMHGLERTGRADRAVWRALATATVPVPRYRSGTHFEVDKWRQVVFEVVRGRVLRIIDASTGATGNTPVGVWHVYDKTPGFNAKLMYYSMFFLRGFAIHGYPEVPPYPASHGCVRIPIWIAPLLYATHGYGTTIIIY